LRLLWVLLSLCAVTALLGACGGDDGGKASDPSEDRSADEDTDATAPEDAGAGEPADDDQAASGVCGLLDLADISEMTGETFDKATPDGDDTCVFSTPGDGAAIALYFAQLDDGVTPDAALADARTRCDEGSVVELDFSDSDGGFGCVASGVPTVVATGGAALAVLTGVTLDETIGDDQVLQALAAILERAITSA
jgi:hypothetical protein